MQIRAFTLVESLLVLGITSFVIIVFSSSLLQTIHIVRGELFVLRFENLYQNAQEDAGLLGENETILAKNKSLFCENEKIEVPDEVQFNDFNITFNEKGENSSLKKIQLNLPYENKKIIYQLEMGSGKYKKSIN
ncbi:competence type IV pilus minor pilin ComGD [Lactococcus nasutitermitis]|uniref:Competence type IV pilus minor pilin ComGD n=1 Tax=Lactococcus nasutitermitis TaxID=1652957 RepID=A0ABV9JFR9_9LACT|nr:competence type IV pilus minor pilin ComGD [Lactococcus nasutitermitis]